MKVHMRTGNESLVNMLAERWLSISYDHLRRLCTALIHFLKHRSQCVLVEGAKSDPAHMVSVVPQGTVMGPLFFSSILTTHLKMSPLRSGCLQLTVFCTDLSTMLVINFHCSVIWTILSSGVTHGEWSLTPRSVHPSECVGNGIHSRECTPSVARSCRRHPVLGS